MLAAAMFAGGSGHLCGTVWGLLERYEKVMEEEMRWHENGGYAVGMR